MSFIHSFNRSRRLVRLCATIMLFASCMIPSQASAGPSETPLAGVANFTFDAPHRQRLVQATVWYPAARGGVIDKVGANAVFKGTLGLRDAYPDGKTHPLIVFSHGSGGNPGTLAWIARRLAQAGFVVALPTHQGTSSADSTPEQTIKVWERSEDMSRVLDALLDSPVMSKMIDHQDITAMGFSLGGHTALSVVGARAVAADYARFCAENPRSLDCVWFDRGAPNIPGHVDFRSVNQASFGATQVDRRFKRFVIVDPAFSQAYDTESLRAISVPGLVLSMGQGEEIMATVRPNLLQSNLHKASFETVAGANHFSFLSECTALANVWIWLEGDDPICRETAERTRANLHAEIAAKILAYLASPAVN